MRKVMQFIQALILALWLGGMIFFAVVVAPSAFQALPSRHLAGAVVSVTLQRLNAISSILLLLFILTVFLPPAFLKVRWSSRQKFLLVLTSLALLLTFYSRFSVDRRLHHLRDQIGVVDNLPTTDSPLRAEFDRMHQRSVSLFGLNIGVGLLLLGVWVKEQP
jgi:hypothetical protein